MYDFLKGHGTENDFVLLPDLDGQLHLTPELVRALTDRRAGIGADGVLRVVRSANDPESIAMADSAEFFMDSLDPNGTFDQRLGVWALTNPQVVATGGTPTLSNVVIPSEAYGIPPGAEQKGTTSLLDSGDDRMQQVQYINGELWGALDTSVTIPKVARTCPSTMAPNHPP